MKNLNSVGIILILTFLIIIFSNFVSATQITLGTVEKGSDISLMQTCGNCSFNNISYIVYPNKTIEILNIAMTKNGVSFYYDSGDAYTQDFGKHDICGFGDVSGVITTWCYDYFVTPNGEEVSSGKSIFYIGLLAVLIFFMVLGIYAFVSFDGLLSRVGMFGISYLILIAITFVGWNMANDFLTSAPFIASFLRILFFVLTIGVLPLVIGGFAWFVIMAFKVKEIQRLMDRGFSMDEAERRQGKKYK